VIAQETIDSAKKWYQTGVARIRQSSFNQGLSYLDKAVAVFQEINDLRNLTHALHYKLLAYKLDERYEEIEGQFPDVMDGYTMLDDSYGQSLLLCHFAESLAKQSRHGRALGYYNLSAALAEKVMNLPLWCYVLENHGMLYQERRNQIQALRLFELGEELAEEAGLTLQFNRCRMARSQTLLDLGEQGEALAMLEDVQVRLMHAEQYREAVDVLSALRKLYSSTDMDDDRNRVTRLLHLCGQHILRTDSERVGPVYQGPVIGGEDPA